MNPMTVTDCFQANEQLLYFTTSSLTADDRKLVFISDRTGDPNLFVRDLLSGAERQLSFNREGTLLSYVYFGGNPYRGLGKASVSLDAERQILYFLQGRQIVRMDLEGRSRVLAELPEGQVTAFTHVSADGTRICVPTTDARALEAEQLVNTSPGYTVGKGDKNEVITGKPDYDIDLRVREENLSSYLHIYDTATGAELHREQVPRAWITHVQFSPENNDLILYNHEWALDSGINRLWIWDGREHRRLRPEGEGRSRQDWTCHEMWQTDGRAIIYHGKYQDGTAYIGRVAPDGTNPQEIRLPESYQKYGHFAVANIHNDWLVSDGYYRPDQEPDQDGAWAGKWLSLQKVHWEQRRMEWVPLCPHLGLWDCQDSHPHPIFNHRDTAVFFTSSHAGKRTVAKIDLPGETRRL